MSENTEFVTLKQGGTVIQNKYTKKDLEGAAKKLKIALDLGLVFALALFVFFLFNLSITYTASPSMVPTLSVGDIGVYGPVGEIERGDIVLFDPVTEENAHMPAVMEYAGEELTKRVIGLPGERVRMEAGVVYINGEPLDEPYAVYSGSPDPYALYLRDMDEIIVPDGCYFLLGDNRDHSSDSRVFGVFPRENITRSRIFSFPSITGLITGVGNDDQFV